MDGVGYLYTGETSGLDRPIDAKYHAGSWLDERRGVQTFVAWIVHGGGHRRMGGDLPFDPTAPPLLEIAEALAREAPDDECAKVPTDLAANVDHYLYGTPKREPGPPPTGSEGAPDRACTTTADVDPRT